MLDALLAKVMICQHTNQQIREVSMLPGACPICLRARLVAAKKFLTSYKRMADKLSDLIATVPGLKATTLTEAVAILAERTNAAEANLKIATSPKAMGRRNAAIAAELEKARTWAQSIFNDERVSGWVHGADYELYKMLVAPPVDFSVLEFGGRHEHDGGLDSGGKGGGGGVPDQAGQPPASA